MKQITTVLRPYGEYYYGTSTSSGYTQAIGYPGYAASVEVDATFIYRPSTNPSDVRTASLKRGNAAGSGGEAYISATSAAAKANAGIPNNFDCISGASHHTGKIQKTSGGGGSISFSEYSSS